jgi:general nucleoside transport system permease protein
VSDEISILLNGAVRTATPLAIAALGESVSERAGVLNLGLEGCIIAGAFASVIGAVAAGPIGGFTAAILAGATIASIFALFTVVLRADQIVTGTAVNLLAFGLTGTLYSLMYGVTGTSLSLPTITSWAIPILDEIPGIGSALFSQTAVTYLLYVLAPVVWWILNRTYLGLNLRAVGERPAAGIAAGIGVRRLQGSAVLFGGALGGLAGGALVIGHAGTFTTGMSAGRGFIAIAIVVLGRWSPLGVMGAALLFGAATAGQFALQAGGFALPYQLFLALPYVLTLLTLAGFAGRVRAPSALGQRELDA